MRLEYRIVLEVTWWQIPATCGTVRRAIGTRVPRRHGIMSPVETTKDIVMTQRWTPSLSLKSPVDVELGDGVTEGGIMTDGGGREVASTV